MESAGVKKIVLNEEQTKRFLSFFISEAFEIVNKRNQLAQMSQDEQKTGS